MFEAHQKRDHITCKVLHLLRRYLGEYVHGLSAEALRISVWKGDVVLKDLNLKAEALNSLKLPVTVKAGFVGTITLKVPWKSLGKEPVIVLIDRVFILAHPAPDGQTLKDDREKLFEAKLQHIEEAESAILEAKSRSKHGSPPENSWFGSLIATIIGNLKISISNVHIRYEDSVSNPGHPFASGITLARLAAVTMDEQGNEIFDTSGALDKLRKSLHLERLALYHNSNSFPWKIDKRWEDLSPTEWIEIFEDGINEPAADSGMVSSWALSCKYLVSPINGVLQYHRLGNQERNDPEIPFEKASLVLTDVSLTITEEQYHDWMKLLEVFSRHRTFVEVYHLRPFLPVSEVPRLWWRYAVQASLQQKKMCYRFSWDKIQHLCQLRRRYVQLYACSLQQSSTVDNSEIREIEADLDSKVILLWRLLAHAKVESVKSKEETKKRRLKKKSWFRYTWLPNSEGASVGDALKESQLVEESLTNEEWQTINKLLSYQPDEELMSHLGKDMHNMTKFLVTVSIGQAAARIMSINETEILCGRFEQLHVSTKFKHCSTHCDILLKFYGLSSPEGSLAESVSSETKENALAATFVRSPVGENVDWRLSATISPCHVTVLMKSFDKFFELIKRSNAISPTIALETATALQMKFEKVTRRAQEQFQMVLEEQSSFALDIDLDAPKVRVPIRTSSFSRCDSYFLLDFGHFTLHTMGGHSEENKQNIYSRFYISGRDIAAFFIDGTFDTRQCTSVIAMDYSQPVVSPTMEKVDSFYSLIDRCGMAVIVDQIKVPHPSYPSTRVSVQVPNLGVHFSPERYLRLMELLNLLKGTMETYGQPCIDDFQANLAPWCPADLAVEARILVWTGIGNSVAAWQPCFLVLSGLYLYVMESEKSKSYQRYLSMAGRHVFEIPPANIGGSPFCIAISFRGMDSQKALESSGTLIIKFWEDSEKATWLKELMGATYQASVPPMDDVLSDKTDGVAEFNELQTTNLKTANLVIDGALVETTLFIYGKSGDKVEEKLEETLILEVLADGAKVHLISLDGDLGVKMNLHSLKIKDALQDRQSANQQYLAYSVLKKDDLLTPHGTCDTLEKESSVVHKEEDDTFTDALPEFLTVTEMDVYSPKVDTSPSSMINGMNHSDEFESAEALIHENDLIQGKGISSEIFYEAQGGESSDFVSVAFSMRSSSSPDYQGIDMQMSIHMSKLEFFCNRPTLVALIGFGFDLRAVNYAVNQMDMNKSSDESSLTNNEKKEDNGRVKGLLGYGKDRVMFYFTMNVDTVSVFLNKEDGSQLAMFVQESFLLDFKVYPSAIYIEGTLGNFRLCDMSLGADHCWGWFCDIRNPGVESLIKFKFDSYNVGDDNYEGYDYSLSGRLSGVRIVFLYRFIQEISAYFMELATPHSEEVIKLVDKVGGFEWLIKKYEMDGASAWKLDLSLDTPIIIVPRNSVSKDFIQLDLGQLKVTNEINWHGSSEKDPSAVHIDVLHAEITGVNMSVGINGSLGKPMIQDGQGLDIFVRRSLRDVFRKLPTFSLEVKVGSLHVVMSDKEYHVILNCTSMNLNEAPNLPASFRGSKSDSNETMRMLVDKVNLNSQILLSHSVTVLAVEVEYALLELCTGIIEESPLAHVALEGFWVSYRMTSSSERDLYVTIPKFSIMDIRPGTKPEMRLMLGSSTDASKQPSSGKAPFLNERSFKAPTSEVGMDIDVPVSTMLLMDYRCRASSQSYVVRVQQPRVLVVPDFLLAVGEFFVPALGTITGRDEIMDPKNDPISRNHSIVLNGPVHLQSEDVVHLSPSRQLIADVVGVEEYTYDGCGKIICLSAEKHLKDFLSAKYQPIIIIGRGKRLRFINVKIENGSLLRNYTYLSNDSSYSVAIEDGVDILVSDNFSVDDGKKNVDHMPEYYAASNVSSHSQSDSKVIQSLTFEAQVVSPELVFYDGTKSSLDDSLYSEKLLCAKMDLSFRYVSKENDTWIHALLKDLIIEAGSGLIILDPVDISGGYTSGKKKTNMSLMSTDVFLHLSLGVLSLLLNLHSQVATALQFGNMVPLASCTNFNQIWMSPKENGSSNNVTIWRPEAPSNYVILGDCVTSRSIPPSQAVMAVSNTYGRVRKPIGFNFIGLLSRVQGIEGHSDVKCDCSLWMPIAPPGYTAMGCVANVGDQPPSNHIVYCLRSDLVTSTTFSECIFSAPSNPGFTSGFSIWRMDNVLGSFYAHSSIECPSKGISCDLNHVLLWNSIQSHLPTEASSSSLTDDHEHGHQQTSTDGANSSGWDGVRSISKATSCYTSTPHFERIWWDKGSELCRPVSIWRPITRSGYAMLGDCVIEGLEPPNLGIIFKSGNPEISAKPVQFTKVAHIVGRGFDEAFFWYPVAPSGYASLGCVVSKADQAPSIDLVCCPRIDIVKQANILDVPISRSSSSKASQCWSIWKVENQGCTFIAHSDLKKPSSQLAYTICDSVKPKTRENVTAEVKLRRFSLTVLGSLCGMMTPLFDTTITNIRLSTHGLVESMNAALICSIAASTFNTQLESWEPLIESFDGIFKFETYDTSVRPTSSIGKRVHVTATNILNINVSAANVETFVETILSWRRQLEFEQKTIKLHEETDNHFRSGEDTTMSVLNVDDFKTVMVENKLGCDIYLKKVEEHPDTVAQLHHGDCASVCIPPPRFSDRLNVVDESREARCYIVVQIIEAKGLPIIDDGNSHNFFCALRLVVDSQVSDQQKLFPQSARTKCVKPLVSESSGLVEGTAKWNELFIFEVPRKGLANVEVEVTNLAAKAGKGEVISALSFPVGHGVNMLKNVGSTRMLNQSYDVQDIVSYSLRRKAQPNNDGDMQDSGHLFVSNSYFERKTIASMQRDAGSESHIDREVGFWVGLHPDGAMKSIRSLLPLSVVPKSFDNEFIATEVILKNGKKHAIFRGLVAVVNDADFTLGISVCHSSFVNDKNDSLGISNCNVIVEEIFENQYFQPNSGWGDKRPGSLNNGPGHWSTNVSYSSNEFFEPPLPPGWCWTSAWTVAKSQLVDDDGWAYGPGHQSLKWPLMSSKSRMKSVNDVMRRRRWIRIRQQVTDRGGRNTEGDFLILTPGSSAVLPWRFTFKDSNYCLQILPVDDESSCTWARAVAIGSNFAFGKDQALVDQVSLYRQSTLKQGSKFSNLTFKLNQLEKKDLLFCCSPSTGSKQIWLSVGADASVLHTELNTPVYDWRISINSPLKLENRLPCPSEFTVWEKTKEGRYVERQHGIISSRESEHIYAADVQRPLYLTLFVQGGWVLEKDPVLVLDLSSNANISSFWMFHKQSKRRLRVNIERDMGGSTVAPKTIRFFVPYWIINDSSLPLAYRVVEIESSDNAEMDSNSLSRAVKSARTALKNPTFSMDRRQSSCRRNIQVVEVIEDTSPVPSMLSPQDSAGRSGVMLFQSQKDAYVSPRVGIAVAIRSSEIYDPGISLLELEKKERVDVTACSSDGSYYKLSAILNMTSDRTKVVHFQPQTLFINRVGLSLCLQQCDSQFVEWIHPTDPPKPFRWHCSAKVELLKLRVRGYKWSTPFSVSNEGAMCISLNSDTGSAQLQLRVAVRGGTKSSRYEVIFRLNSFSSPYRIENCSMFLPVRFRQVDGTSGSWQFLLPNSAASFLWEDLGRRHLLELVVDGTDISKSEKYDIDEIFDHQPNMGAAGGPAAALRVTILKEERTNVVKITDWMPENEPAAIMSRRIQSPLSQVSRNDSQNQQSLSSLDCEFHVIVELAELGISIVDHTPEEILYLSVQNVLLAYSTGLGSGFSRILVSEWRGCDIALATALQPICRFKFRLRGIQVDNQLPLTLMPVLFRPQRAVEETDYILKFWFSQQTNGSLDLYVYPNIGFFVPENCTFLINIHEPVIWRLHEMIQQVNIHRLYDTRRSAVSVDPFIQIGALNISEIRFKVSMTMSPSQRPRGVLGFWSSLMTALGNTENMTVRINQRFHENMCMRQSTMTSNAIANIRKDLLGQPLQLLSGLDILGNASSALGHMSKGVAALSMDKKFILNRQESKGVEDFGDFIREGGGALAKGLFRGVTGILTKPLEGAKSSGVEGFVQGVGKGIIGAAAQPVSGVLDLLSKTTEGANAMRMKIASAIASDEQLLRRRLPRVIGGDNLLHPYDEYKAQGQVILQLAESGSFFGQVDLFKVRGKFALSDAYEDHFLLPKGKILMVTHRRVILLQQPSNIVAQRKFSPARDPCSILWDVLWDDLITMELTHGKKDNPKAFPSRVVLYLHIRSTETKEQVLVIKCSSETHQAVEVYSSIERARNTYGNNLSKETLKKKVMKPYTPLGSGNSEVNPKEGVYIWSPQQVPGSVPFGSSFGSSSG